MYFNKAGEPITTAEYLRLKDDPEYTLVKNEMLPNGKFIFTWWVGFDIYISSDAHIFETLVYDSERQSEVLHHRRYRTLDSAIIGHAEAVLDFNKEEGLNPPG